MASTTVERKIHFYRAYLGLDESGHPLPFDLTAALAHLGQLPFSPAGRYLDEGDTSLCCWVDQYHPSHHLRFGQIRRAGLPQLERAGRLRDLNIPADSGLAETIHVVTFPNNIVGADFNFFGPRMSRLSAYLKAKAADLIPDVAFEPLVRLDVSEQLARLEDIRLFHLRIRSSYAASVAQADADLGAAFDAAARVGQAEELEIVLRPRRYSRQPLGSRVLQLARRLARNPDLRTEASRFCVRGTRHDTGHLEEIDILSDQLIASVSVMRQSARGRALDSASVYAGIAQAYAELSGSLEIAASIEI